MRYGFAGARVDRIAVAAGANKRMIYHYFGDKRGLFSASIEQELADLSATADLDEWLTSLFDVMPGAAARLLAWSGLQDDVSVPFASLAEVIRERFVVAQRSGRLPEDLDPGLIASCVLGTWLLPEVLPQLHTQLARPAEDETVARQTRLRFVRYLLTCVSQAGGVSKPRIRLKPKQG